jgi:hypothetical protein
MPLCRRAVRTRATRFVQEFAQAHHAEADAKPFGLRCVEVCGIQARTVGSNEVQVKKLDQALGKIHLFLEEEQSPINAHRPQCAFRWERKAS